MSRINLDLELPNSFNASKLVVDAANIRGLWVDPNGQTYFSLEVFPFNHDLQRVLNDPNIQRIRRGNKILYTTRPQVTLTPFEDIYQAMKEADELALAPLYTD